MIAGEQVSLGDPWPEGQWPKQALREAVEAAKAAHARRDFPIPTPR